MAKWSSVAIVTVVSVFALELVPAGAVDLPEIRSYQGTAYISGGTGEDERQALQSATADFPLKIVGARNSGDYVADVHVVIRDARGKKVLEAVTEGPWLFARLAPGVYQMESIFDGEVRRQTVRVGSSGQTVVMTRWGDEREK